VHSTLSVFRNGYARILRIQRAECSKRGIPRARPGLKLLGDECAHSAAEVAPATTSPTVAPPGNCTSLLDLPISVEVKERRADEFLQVLCSAVSRAGENPFHFGNGVVTSAISRLDVAIAPRR